MMIENSTSASAKTVAKPAMVPNSLGPGELLMQFGTQEQRDHWLPRLARGEEIPCFGLTSPEAGSDAAAMTDTGVVCRQAVDGREVHLISTTLAHLDADGTTLAAGATAIQSEPGKPSATRSRSAGTGRKGAAARAATS